MPAYKVVLVGDAKVGKTSILSCWASGGSGLSDYYEPTVSPELTTKDVSVDGRALRLQVARGVLVKKKKKKKKTLSCRYVASGP
mmetsp:Transcript_17113/g.13902  ORF Transcript_17113/g.13902 Transcript_17113/m.13902 type:complete len:84 (+) Transcript_17113:209-460(+)